MEENENRTNPAEEAENETEAIKALRDAYDEKLRQKNYILPINQIYLKI